MADKKMIMIVAAIVVVIAVIAAAVMIASPSNDDPSEKIKIIDGAGKEIILDKPLDKVVIGNTNVPKMCVILGAEEYVTGLSFYATGSDKSNWDKYSPLFPNATHMSIEPNMTAEEVSKVAKAVIVPVSSMTISYAQELSYNQMGITVIRLNCNGETAQEDMEKLTILFGKTDKIMANYNDYWGYYNKIVDDVKEKAKEAGVGSERFLFYYSGLTAFYNQTSSMSAMTESVAGKNSLREIVNLDLSGVSNRADQLGIREAITELDHDKPIDVLFMRGSSSMNSESLAEKMFKDSEIFKSYMNLSAIENNEIYAFMSEPMSGCLSYVGYVLIAEAIGVDTGYNPTDLVDAYNKKYGFSESTTGLSFHITVDGSEVTATQLF